MSMEIETNKLGVLLADNFLIQNHNVGYDFLVLKKPLDDQESFIELSLWAYEKEMLNDMPADELAILVVAKNKAEDVIDIIRYGEFELEEHLGWKEKELLDKMLNTLDEDYDEYIKSKESEREDA